MIYQKKLIYVKESKNAPVIFPFPEVGVVPPELQDIAY
jgi:hypothetical protein